jgi:hypothetical protein
MSGNADRALMPSVAVAVALHLGFMATCKVLPTLWANIYFAVLQLAILTVVVIAVQAYRQGRRR